MPILHQVYAYARFKSALQADLLATWLQKWIVYGNGVCVYYLYSSQTHNWRIFHYTTICGKLIVLRTFECHGLLPANFCKYSSKEAKTHSLWINKGNHKIVHSPYPTVLPLPLSFANPLVKLQGIGVPANSCHLLLGSARMYAAAISAPQLYPFSLRWEAYKTHKGLIRMLHAHPRQSAWA